MDSPTKQLDGCRVDDITGRIAELESHPLVGLDGTWVRSPRWFSIQDTLRGRLVGVGRNVPFYIFSTFYFIFFWSARLGGTTYR